VTKPLTYKIGADLGDLRRKMEEAGNLTRQASQELRKMEQQQRQHRQAMTDLGTGMLGFGAAATLGLGMAVREAIKWESAFAGVRKTVDGSDEEIAALEGELRGLAKTLPATHQEIAAVAEAAGQLGIKRQDIAEFTETMIALGETTNLTADQAATSLAQFMNIMGTSASDVDRLGSALVALGNAGASTEQDIISMGLRIAGAGRQVGLSEDEVLAFASALSSVGIEAEAGGSSFSRVMIDMSSAVQGGGQKLADFAQIAGMSGDRFTKVFKEDASTAIITFIQGLGKMQASGGDVLGVLERLGFTEIRVRDALLRAASASDMFTDSLKTGSQGWAENEALAEEAAKRYQTTEAQMQTAGNAIKDAMIDIGAALLPIVQGGIEGIRNLVSWFQDLPEPVQTAIVVLGAITAAVTVLGGAALIGAVKILAFRESMTGLVEKGGAVTGALGKFGLFMTGPWGAAIGLGITLLGAFGIAAGGSANRQQELAEAGKSVAEAIREQNGVINDSVRRVAAKQAAEHKMLDAAKQLGIELPVVTDAILQQGGAYEKLRGQLEATIKAGTTQVNAGKSGTVTRYTEEANAAKQLLGELDAVVDGKNNELQTEKDVTEATKEGTAATEDQSGANKELAATAEEVAEALDGMISALDRLNGVTLSHREAQRNLIKAIGEANGVFAENSKTLDANTTEGIENAEALDGIASAMNDAAAQAAEEAKSTGGAAAGHAALVASLNASRQQLFNIARQFHDSEQATWDYVDSVLAVPDEAKTDITTPGSMEAQMELQRVRAMVMNIPPDKEVNVGVLSQEAIRRLQEIGFKVNELPDGTVSVSAQTAAAQHELDRLANANANKVFNWTVRITSRNEVGRQGLGGQFTPAYGGIVQFASGGIFGESHHPQIAKAMPGAVRVWAEPETGNESYIPWAMDRRGRATDILRTTADAFGYALVPRSQMVRSYADGGINGAYAGGAGSMLAGCNIQVFVGDRELTDIVDVRISENTRRTVRHVTAGAGNTR
jgi:TP901 family phage tail tape measure protein